MGFRVKLWLIAIAVFGFDRAMKWWVSSHMVPGQSIPILGRVVSFTYVLNSGAAFGLLLHRDALFIVVAAALLIGVAWMTVTKTSMPGRLIWGLALLAGGAAGNLWDRIISGRVIDYVNFHFWPVFNAADSAIVIGMGLILLEFWQRGASDGRSADGEHSELSGNSSGGGSRRTD